MKRMKEIMELGKEVKITSKKAGCETNIRNARHQIVESVPRLILDLAGTKCDLTISKDYFAAKKRVERGAGILLIGGARHVAKGEKRTKDDLTKDEVHCESWRELARTQEAKGMYHAWIVPSKSRATRTQSYKRMGDNNITAEGETLWNIQRQRETKYNWMVTPGEISNQLREDSESVEGRASFCERDAKLPRGTDGESFE